MMYCPPKSKSVRYSDSQLIDLAEYPGGILPMQNVDSSGRLEEYKDMVDLPFMHEVSSDTSSASPEFSNLV